MNGGECYTRILSVAARLMMVVSLQAEVPNVVFVEGLVIERGRRLVYYGGADKYVGVASIALGSQ